MSRPSPFSIRFTQAERARLLEKAGGRPLGTFIKEAALGAAVTTRAKPAPVRDAIALGRVLGVLGRSHLANNLNQIAKAANLGALPVTPELETELHAACADVRAMRRLLMQALGIEAHEVPAPLVERFNQAAGGSPR